MAKRFKRPRTAAGTDRKAGATVLVKLRIPEASWRVIRSRAALAGQPVGVYAAQVLVSIADTKGV